MNARNVKKKKLFVASGSRNGLVDSFIRELQEQAKPFEFELEVQDWYHNPSQNMISVLTNQCRGSREGNIAKSDFVAAVFTKNDLLAIGGHQAAQGGTPRDHVVFALGLFLGALGFEARRGLMLCSADGQLPGEIRGLFTACFDAVSENDPNEFDRAVRKAAGDVIRHIYSLPPVTEEGPEIVTQSEMLDREWTRGERAELQENGEVLVHRAQPVELNTGDNAAAQVDRNIRDGVTYVYFFQERDFKNIARLLHRVASANPNENGEPIKTPLLPADLETHLREQIVNQLRINVLPKQGSLEFCIHNAHVNDGARCYVRIPSSNEYVRLCQDAKALEVAKKLKELEVANDVDPIRVFRPTQTFDIYEAKYKSQKDALWAAIVREFRAEPNSSLEKTLRKVCFGEEAP